MRIHRSDISKPAPSSAHPATGGGPRPSPSTTGGVMQGRRSLYNPAAAHPLHARPRWPVPHNHGLAMPARTPQVHSGATGGEPPPPTPGAADQEQTGPVKVLQWRLLPPRIGGSEGSEYRRRRSGSGLPLHGAADGGRRAVVRCLPFACCSC